MSTSDIPVLLATINLSVSECKNKWPDDEAIEGNLEEVEGNLRSIIEHWLFMCENAQGFVTKAGA